MKKLILHIGYFKTGTTSLQHYLVTNRAALADRGVVVPRTGVVEDNGHVMLASSPLHECGAKIPRWIGSTPNYKELWLNTLKEIHKADCHTAIISNEHFIDFVDYPKALSLIRPFLKDLEVHVICYLRRIDEYFLSWYNHCVKSGWTIESFQEFYGYHQRTMSNQLYHGRVLDLYSQEFGTDSVHVKIFDSQHLVDGDIVSDFFTYFDLRRTHNDAALNKNKKMSTELLQLKTACNVGMQFGSDFLKTNENINRILERMVKFTTDMNDNNLDSNTILNHLWEHIEHVDSVYCSGYKKLHEESSDVDIRFNDLFASVDNNTMLQYAVSLIGMVLKENFNTHLQLVDLQNKHQQLMQETRTQNMLLTKLLGKLDAQGEGNPN